MRAFRHRLVSRYKIEPDPPKPVYKNLPEESFRAAAIKAGWDATKRGWPDFIITKNGRVAFVEVKPDKGQSGNRRLSEHQWAVMTYLANLGAECYSWSPRKGFARIRQSKFYSGKVGDERGSQSPDSSPMQHRKGLRSQG